MGQSLICQATTCCAVVPPIPKSEIKDAVAEDTFDKLPRLHALIFLFFLSFGEQWFTRYHVF